MCVSELPVIVTGYNTVQLRLLVGLCDRMWGHDVFGRTKRPCCFTVCLVNYTLGEPHLYSASVACSVEEWERACTVHPSLIQTLLGRGEFR